MWSVAVHVACMHEFNSTAVGLLHSSSQQYNYIYFHCDKKERSSSREIISFVLCHFFVNLGQWSITHTNTNTTELVWRPLQTKFGQGRLTIKKKIKNVMYNYHM